MAQPYRTMTYKDELLVDGTVHRTYSNGAVEWRERLPDGRVKWQDGTGRDWSGIDELLGDRYVKRLLEDGTVLYGCEQGYGRTAWSHGFLTINQSSFGGQVGMILASFAGGVLLGSILPPPSELTPEAEEELRRQAQEQAGPGFSFELELGENGESDWGESDWSDPYFGDIDFFG